MSNLDGRPMDPMLVVSAGPCALECTFRQRRIRRRRTSLVRILPEGRGVLQKCPRAQLSKGEVTRGVILSEANDLTLFFEPIPFDFASTQVGCLGAESGCTGLLRIPRSVVRIVSENVGAGNNAVYHTSVGMSTARGRNAIISVEVSEKRRGRMAAALRHPATRSFVLLSLR